MIFQRTIGQQYPRTVHQQRSQERGSWGQGCRCEFHRKQRNNSVESKTCPGNRCLERSQVWANARQCPRELSDASLIQARIQVPLAFPDRLGVE